MGIRIKRVAVLGAGVMGQGIAAHLANAGIPSYLFDIAPGELTADEQKKGLTLESRAVRNRIADAGVAAMIKASPALLYRADLASLVTACNYVDDMALLGECDWIVEVVVERLDIKQRVFTDVEKHRKPGSIVSSNTSGPVGGRHGRGAERGLPPALHGDPLLQPGALHAPAGVDPLRRHRPGPLRRDGRLRGEGAGQGHRLRQGHPQLHRQPHRRVRHRRPPSTG